MAKPKINKPQTYTIVVKLGSSSIVDEITREPRIANMSRIVETLVKLRRQGHRIVIVSSGAIAVGLKRVGLTSKPKKLSKVQALASIGQGRLIALWDDLFTHLNQTIAQILLTRNDIIDWTQFQNAKNTMNELLDMNIIPIVNENDTLSVQEIRFGDNDTLSAITAGMINADYLFLLTDVECLYTDNPRTNPNAKPILVVEDISSLNVDTSSGSGSGIGTGGMTTKLIAAELAMSAGVTTIINKSTTPENIMKIVKHIQSESLKSDLENHDTPKNLREIHQMTELQNLKINDVPLHTRFIGDSQKVKDKQFWLLHGLKSYGSIIIDIGAYNALTRKNKAGLLPVGVIDIEGSFHEAQCVTLKLGKRDKKTGKLDMSEKLVEVGKARVNYTSSEISKIKGLQSNEIEKVLGYADSEYIAHRENLAFPHH
ncbi:glutamate 5-kinase [Ascoidea rubescens DSM 1968]|uniref:Glutamate 5-kinase n=1 Tax=Ascoidea rubescens DSM 1968 TaxID=1344418 RepID=A0A1D2VES6_9ASCO|nr:glutamate 5-kinase [Ascoidea rubescens DSM 1968]ODV60082.1 glutamate 5-kinase [Ascoidea rubescens DSM 1968]